MRHNNSTATGLHRAIAANEAVNVINPIADALHTLLETFDQHSLTTEQGSERAARLLQLLLAKRGWYLLHETEVSR